MKFNSCFCSDSKLIYATTKIIEKMNTLISTRVRSTSDYIILRLVCLMY